MGLILAQAPVEPTPNASGSRLGGMSDRIRQYLDEGGGPEGAPGAGPNAGANPGPGAGAANGEPMDRRRQMREKLRQMTPEQRREMMQRFRGPGRGGPGALGPQGGPGPRTGDFPGPPGGPEGASMKGGRRSADQGVRNFRRGRNAEGGGRRLFGRKPLDFSSLNLTDKQKEQIQKMRSANAAKARSLQQDLRERRKEMKALMFSPEASRKDILAKRDELRRIQHQAEDVMLEDFLGIRDLLTAEQMQKLPEVKPGRHRNANAPRAAVSKTATDR